MEIASSHLQPVPAFIPQPQPQPPLMSGLLPPPLTSLPPRIPSQHQPHSFPPYYAYHDHHYFYYLQQQLLLLHHHHQYQMQSQVPHLLNLSVQDQASPNMNYLQSLENSVKNIKNSGQKEDP